MEISKQTQPFQRVSVDSFKSLLLEPSDEKFRTLKDQYFSDTKEAIIGRFTAQQISEETKLIKPFDSELTYTLIKDVEIFGDVELRDFQETLKHPLFCLNCQFSNFIISGHADIIRAIIFNNCTIKTFSIESSAIQDLVFEDSSTTEVLKLYNSSIINLSVFNSKLGIIDLFKISSYSLKFYDKSEINGEFTVDESEIIDFHANSAIFKGFLIIKKSKINALSLTGNSKASDITLDNCGRFERLNISESSSHYLISKKTNIGNLKLQKSQFYEIDLYESSVEYAFSINLCEIEGLINIRNRSDVSRIYIYNSHARGTNFSRSKLHYLKISGSYLGGISIKKCSCGNIYLEKNSKTGDLLAEKSSIDNLEATNQFGSYMLKGVEISLLVLENCSIPQFDISGGVKIEAYVIGGNVNLISFTKSSLIENSLISFSDTRIYALQFEEFSVLGKLYFRKMKISRNPFEWWSYDQESAPEFFGTKIPHFINGQRVQFEKMEKELLSDFPSATIRISNSSLGRTEFTSCTLGKFRFEFNNSKITECFISGGTVPEDNIVIIDDENKPLPKNSKESCNQKASFFNQLKKIFEAQGDAYRAAQFQAKWAEHQKIVLEEAFKEEKRSLNIWKIFRHLKNEKAQDISIFWFNQKSNRHGENWLQAIRFILIVSIPAYILFLTLSGRCFTSEPFDFNLIGHYFEFLNPVRTANFIEGLQPTWCSVIIDFFARLFIAYGLYQFIAAFRKHGRKK